MCAQPSGEICANSSGGTSPFVEADLGTPLHVRVEDPLYDKECPLDAANHPQRNRQIVLPGIGCEFSEQLARFHFTGGHRSRTTEEIRPVCNNQFLADFATGADPITTFWNATSEFLPPEENRGCSATPLTEPRRASDL